MFESEWGLLLWLLKPLVLTILIESGVAWLCGVREGKFYRAMFCINTITNPLLNLFLSFLYANDVFRVNEIVWFCEIAIVVIEWQLLLTVFPGQKTRMFLLSLAMNAASYLFGVVLVTATQ